MAAEIDTNGMDMPAHAESYTRFLWWLKFGALGSFAVGAFAVFLLAR